MATSGPDAPAPLSNFQDAIDQAEMIDVREPGSQALWLRAIALGIAAHLWLETDKA